MEESMGQSAGASSALVQTSILLRGEGASTKQVAVEHVEP